MKYQVRSIRKNFTSLTVVLLSSAAICCLVPSVALAQVVPAPGAAGSVETPASSTGQGTGMADIIVTAQRKAERLQDVPIAINVIGSATLAQAGLVNTLGLTVKVPGLSFNTIAGTQSIVYLRGVGSNDGNPNAEPSVATYIDGVYIAANSANIFDFNNVERIEVLKGPQGTLFGRNATGGVIQVITRDPKQEPSVDAQISYANYDTITGGVYATGGLSTDAAIDLSVQFTDQGKGWGKNVLTGDDVYFNNTLAVRSKLLWTPSEDTEVRISLDYGKRTSDGSSYRTPAGRIDGTPPPSDPYDASALILSRDNDNSVGRMRQFGGSLNLKHDLGDVSLVSITAYRQVKVLYVLDQDTIAPQIVEVILPQRQRSLSQELQALGNIGNIDWTLGAYLFQYTSGYYDGELIGLAFPAPITITGIQRVRSGSLYGQFSAPIAENTKVTGGLRYSRERVRYNVDISGTTLPTRRDGFNKFSWRLALDHAFTPQIHSYISYNRGIKGGGYDLLTPSSPGFKPEILDAYEVGLKSQLFGNRLRLNASAFLYDYRDIQVQAHPAGAVVTTNAGAARIKGVDFDFEARISEPFTLSGGFAVLHGKYKRFAEAVAYPANPLTGVSYFFDAAGQRTVHTPKLTANVTADYVIKTDTGRFILSATAAYDDGYYYDAENRLEQSDYTLLNASLGWMSKDDRFGVTLFAANILDKYYLSQGVPTGLGDLVTPAAPRIYGIRFRTRL